MIIFLGTVWGLRRKNKNIGGGGEYCKEYVIKWLLKIFVGCYYLSCVLASFLRIVSTRKNKRGSHTTLQTDFIISNVRGWQFFDFDTPVYYHVVLTTKWWKPQKKNATFHTFDGCKKFLVSCLTSCRHSKVVLHPGELLEKIWGQHNKIKTR